MSVRGETENVSWLVTGAWPGALAVLVSVLAAAGSLLARVRRRDYVIPDDVQALAVPVLAHRLLAAAEAEWAAADLAERLPLPGAARQAVA